MDRVGNEARGAELEFEMLVRPLCHEVGNLIAGMRIAGHLLAGTLEPAERGALAGEQQRLAVQAGALLAQVRPLLDGAAGKSERVAVTNLLDAVRRNAESCLPPRLRLRIVRGLRLPDVQVDPDAVHQLLLALVLRAAESAGPDGLVRVDARVTPRRVLLTLRDDGPSLDPVELRAAPARGRPLLVGVADAVLRPHGGRARLLAARRGAAVEISLRTCLRGPRRVLRPDAAA